MPSWRPLASDCNSESNDVYILIDSHLKPFGMDQSPFWYKNTYNFVDKTKGLPLHDNFLLITLNVQSVNTYIDHTKGLEAVRHVIGKYPIYDPVIELLEISLMSKEYVFNDERFI